MTSVSNFGGREKSRKLSEYHQIKYEYVCLHRNKNIVRIFCCVIQMMADPGKSNSLFQLERSRLLQYESHTLSYFSHSVY